MKIRRDKPRNISKTVINIGLVGALIVGIGKLGTSGYNYFVLEPQETRERITNNFKTQIRTIEDILEAQLANTGIEYTFNKKYEGFDRGHYPYFETKWISYGVSFPSGQEGEITVFSKGEQLDRSPEIRKVRFAYFASRGSRAYKDLFDRYYSECEQHLKATSDMRKVAQGKSVEGYGGGRIGLAVLQDSVMRNKGSCENYFEMRDSNEKGIEMLSTMYPLNEGGFDETIRKGIEEMRTAYIPS